MYAIAFDAIWTLAKGLNHTEMMRLSKTDNEIGKETGCSKLAGKLVPLNEFEYSNAFMGCVMRYNFHQTDFLGMTVSSTLFYTHSVLILCFL